MDWLGGWHARSQTFQTTPKRLDDPVALKQEGVFLSVCACVLIGRPGGPHMTNNEVLSLLSLFPFFPRA